MNISYFYTRYDNAPLATALDRFLHMPSRIGILFLAEMIFILYYHFCLNSLLPKAWTESAFYKSTEALLVFVLFIFIFFTGILCDRLGWTKKLAKWESLFRSGLLSKKQQNAGRAAVVLLAVFLAAPGIAAGALSCFHRAQERLYSQRMSVLSRPDAPEVAGNKMVAYLSGEDRWVRRYIPEEWQAESPEEAAFILRCTDGSEAYGMYRDSGAFAYVRTCFAEWIDRATGEVVASRVFYGGTPPFSISDREKEAQYGSEPDAEEIEGWVLTFYEENGWGEKEKSSE